MNHSSTANLPLQRVRQRGVVLFISLIVLVAMSLAGIAAWRSVSTGLLIAGNMSFQQGATLSADKGIEAARTWLTNGANASMLTADQASGYYSTWGSAFNVQTFNWTTLGTSVGATADAAGNSVRYVIHRMCGSAGASNLPPPQQCVAISSSGDTDNKEILQGLQGSLQPYYRVTVRVTGPRNTVSYVQSTMY